MPLYEFIREDGTKTDRYYDMGDAPLIGTQIEFDGHVWTRLPPTLGAVQTKSFEFRSLQERRWDPDAPDHVPRGQKFAGAPVFKNRTQMEDFRAKKAHKYGRTLEWDSAGPDEL